VARPATETPGAVERPPTTAAVNGLSAEPESADVRLMAG